MRAAVFAGPRSIKVADRPDPVVAAPTDAVVRVVLACVCGSDLWFYRGISELDHGTVGHEFIGVIDEVGTEVTEFPVGTRVAYSQGGYETGPVSRTAPAVEDVLMPALRQLLAKSE